MKYSVFSLVYEALRGNADWKPAWRNPNRRPNMTPSSSVAAVMVCRLLIISPRNTESATSRCWKRAGSVRGNTGRNTTIIRSNYLLPGNIVFYEWSMKLWEKLEQDLNYNAMVSQRGVVNSIIPTRSAMPTRAAATQCGSHGVDAELLDRAKVRAMLPFLDYDNARFPIDGALMQRRGGTARHDAVAWGYARAADQRGVDIIQNCEVTGFVSGTGASRASRRRAGAFARKKVGLAVAGNTSRLAAMAGLRLPIESHVIQAFVTEGIKPAIDCVLTFGAGHFYISQSDKGGLVFGGDLDGYNTYAQRGNLPDR